MLTDEGLVASDVIREVTTDTQSDVGTIYEISKACSRPVPPREAQH